MKRLLSAALIVFSSFCLLTISADTSAAAESAAAFYKKNPVTMYIGFSAGGGTDYVARLFGKYWPEVTDGGTLIPKNMGGAGGILAANYVNGVKPDGASIVFGMLDSTFLMPYIEKDKAAQYDSTKLNYLVGGMHEPYVVHISSKKPFENVDDLKKAKDLRFAAASPNGGDIAAIIPFLDFLNLDVKLVTGYKGGSASLMAAGKGEIDMVVAPASTGLRAVQSGHVKNPVVVMDYERCPIYPDTPAMAELVTFTPEQEAMFKTSQKVGFILRVAATSPDVPADRVEFMRAAFEKITNLARFQEEAKASFPMGPTPMLGEDLQQWMQDASSIKLDALKTTIRKFLAIK